MKTIKIAVHTELLKAIDAAAHRAKRNRSALICDALREHLRRLEILAGEERDRAGYSKNRHSQDESAIRES